MGSRLPVSHRPARSRKTGVVFWLALVVALWVLVIFAMEMLMDVSLRGPGHSGVAAWWPGWWVVGKQLEVPVLGEAAGTEHAPALEIGSVTQAGALGVAIMELEAKMDKLGHQVFALERSRLNSEMRREMDAESLKLKDKSTGQIIKLTRKRQLDPEEVEGFKYRRDSELRRLAHQIVGETCTKVDECTNSTVNGLERAISGDGQIPLFATTASLSFKTDIEGRRTFGSNLQNVSILKDWLPADISRYRFNTCAVVGNSGILRGSRLGPAIDAHQAVIRTNQAPTIGHERDVGANATLRVLNSVWATSYISHPQAPKLLSSLEDGVSLVATRVSPGNFVRLSHKLSDIRSDVKTLLMANTVMADARMALDRFRLQASRVALIRAAASAKSPSSGQSAGSNYKGGQAPSTGLLAVLLAMRLCASVSVYGFSHEISRDSSSSSWPYHYFSNFVDSAELRAHPHHSFKLEGDLLAHFHRRNLLRLCEDQCNGVPPAGASPRGHSSRAAGGKAAGSGGDGAEPRRPHDSPPGGARQSPGSLGHGSSQLGAVNRVVAAAKARAAESQLRTRGSEKADGGPALPRPGKGGGPGQHPGHSSQEARLHQAQANSGGRGGSGGGGGGGGKKRSKKDVVKEVDNTSAKKMAFMKANSGRLADDVPKLEVEGGELSAALGGTGMTMDQLSPEERLLVEKNRYANEGLNLVLAAAVEDEAELRQVERSLKRGQQKGGKIITLKSGTRLAIPNHGSSGFKGMSNLDDQVPKIVDPMILAEDPGMAPADKRHGKRSAGLHRKTGFGRGSGDEGRISGVSAPTGGEGGGVADPSLGMREDSPSVKADAEGSSLDARGQGGYQETLERGGGEESEEADEGGEVEEGEAAGDFEGEELHAEKDEA
eukprot:CAMPEP_0117658316 /NCGR_PEP_ID=MMETSP0804-20121206/5800_1 /TAXON_ID=1074897 /ORGANISM="Tetraselmis astigmatica, Strain CCMP880" /LENGTH=887 /DNA_ID=CAMNT_0005464831 /DNA_START=202 /DNA_END=2862 /DNA_ORIENTATION=-